MKPGNIVRMNAACKRALFKTGSHDHVKEFGRCYGTIEDLVDYGTQKGPEWNVRWEPSELRYGYAEEDLVLVPLKAYKALHDDDDMDFETLGAIVYAYNTRHARELGAYEINGEYETMYAFRAPQYDDRAALQTAPGAEDDREFLRNENWGREDEMSCGSCGLYPNGLEKYAVCRACSLCAECGCEEGCPKDEGTSCE